MNIRQVMTNDTWPDFVTDDEPTAPPPATSRIDHTGWETVVFELEDHEIEELLSALSTASLAP